MCKLYIKKNMYTRDRLGHCNDNTTQKNICNCTNICRTGVKWGGGWLRKDQD